MKTAKIILGGAEYEIAPLGSLQVAEFFDEKVSTQVQILTKSVRNIVRSLQNSNSPLVDGLEEETAIKKIFSIANDGLTSFSEIDAAFGVLLDVSGLRKKTEGEATATESISSESSAAS